MESAAFGNLIVVVILLNAVTIGVQTYSIPGWLDTGLEWADRIFLGVLTLEGWNSVMYELRAVSAAAIPYTVSFILIGTYIVINLVVGVVITSLDEAYKTRASAEASKHDLTQTIHELRASLDRLESKLHQVGMLDRTTVGAEELEHRVEDHLPHREPAVTRSERRP